MYNVSTLAKLAVKGDSTKQCMQENLKTRFAKKLLKMFLSHELDQKLKKIFPPVKLFVIASFHAPSQWKSLQNFRFAKHYPPKFQ